MFNGEGNSGDDTRKDLIETYFSNLDTYWGPNGFISKQYQTSGEGWYNDFPLSELSYTFGIGFTALFLFYFGIKSIDICRLIRYKKINNFKLIFPVGYLVVCILIFMEGSFLTFPYQSIYSGYILSGLYKKSTDYHGK